MANRTGKGGFAKGRSGNPGGRPKSIASLQLAARQHMYTALKVLIEVAKGGRSEASRVAAATALLDRGYGRPTQSLEMTLDRALIDKKISELTPAELEIFEARLAAIGDGQDDLFGERDPEPGPGPHGTN
jgi:hypothetical protein